MLPLLLPPGAWLIFTLEAPVSPNPPDCPCAGAEGAAAAATPAPMRLSTNSPFFARGARAGSGLVGMFWFCTGAALGGA
eukprot:CAMPEP_0196757674 /NCGR_PEP_ID=MMETSP1091-20130531/103789_1 /TAXON_ID=302021 /ORGANISM="Rhodomonas sp., Strain CCMP768" /LENGTH=78 /DNA_ID=CAMNT_0042106461 /DNA_START=150 /DNA_END=386 /DNA_ORIENTATION=+